MNSCRTITGCNSTTGRCATVGAPLGQQASWRRATPLHSLPKLCGHNRTRAARIVGKTPAIRIENEDGS
eukprot:scaffold115767_cov35-Tisochrysis_lutea.AAC.2